MASITEATVESELLDQLKNLGYTRLNEKISGPDGLASERVAHDDVILMSRLEKAVERLNPNIPLDARQDAIKQIVADDKPSLVEENRRLHRAISEGVGVEYYAKDGTIRGDKVHLIDFDNPEANDWLVLPQFTVIENGHNRRPDVVVFVNGLPLGVVELKNPASETATLASAYHQLQTYKSQIPSLFRTNAVLIISDGLKARIGSLTAHKERFMPWRTTDGLDIEEKGGAEMPILIEGVFEKRRFLELIRDFIVFSDTGSGITKIIAGYHQFHAARCAVESTVSASAQEGDRKVGVIWHTQGSGKSLTMAFYAGQLVRRPELENPTIVVITDRNDLDDQLFGTFSMCSDLIRQTPTQATSREDLQEKLNCASGGVIFTTIQKFSPDKGETEYPVLTKRRNVVAIVDEAHRSQYGFKAKLDQTTGQKTYGFAKYLRDALPKASFIGFTGTPIEKNDKSTRAVFGDDVATYDISRAVEDGATVPIYYTSRLARIELPKDEIPNIDAAFEELAEDEGFAEQEHLKSRGTTTEALVGAEKRLKLVAEDLVQHFEQRVKELGGKAMVVCMSRDICVALYDEIVTLRPDWNSSADDKGTVKIVMTGSASDPSTWQQHVGDKARRDLLAKRAKDPEDSLNLIIVCDMWLTGFDAPSLHTMYIDKPMRGHNLMQAIARVNRVFKEKQGGLVVDYIGIAQSLKSALGQYTAADIKNTGIQESEAVTVMKEKHEVVKSMFHGFNLRKLHGASKVPLAFMADAIEWILVQQCKAAESETSDQAKKKAHRRYQDAVLALSKAFALAAASDEAQKIRDEVGFFQAVRAALVKSSIESTQSNSEQQFAMRQIIDRAIVSTEIVDILAAAGLKVPNISILSDEFLAEIKQMEKKNLAREALTKLIRDEIRSRSQSNVVEARKFSEKLTDAIARYHTNAISTVEVLHELINLAQEMREAHNRGEDMGLSADEIAFYDALADNESAAEMMGNDALKVIAHELLTNLKSNLSVDWSHRESARARMRVLVKRILRKHKYPPDLQNSAVQTVLQQAETLFAQWAA